MRAELVLMGKRIDMAPRAHRRTLVAILYASLALAMAACWFVDRWHTSAAYLILLTIPVNRLFLGGFYFGGLIKPFSGRPPRRDTAPPPYLLLALRVYKPEPVENEYRNDERELAQRNSAFHSAYAPITVLIALLWLLMNFRDNIPRLLERFSVPIDGLLYGLATAAAITAVTLPQAILLWTEPDMEAEG